MGKKKGGSSWLSAVKRAFRSPTKDPIDQDQKREKRRWIFRKPVINHESPSSQQTPEEQKPGAAEAATDQKHALAVAVAAAEAAMATAQAAVEVARLSRLRNHTNERYAAVVIQTAFRGYLARRALRALKGLVKLQALARGHNVRKQAKMTFRCMQALVRVQSRVVDQRVRLSHDGSSRKSTLGDTNSFLESRYLQDISDRRSMQSREGSSVAEDWDERPHAVDEIKAMLRQGKEAALKRDKSLSQAFSQQVRRSGRRPLIGNEEELEERPAWLERWMAAKAWERRGRASVDQRETIKTVEMDACRPNSSYVGSNYRKSHPNYQYNPHQHQPQRHSVASPFHGSSSSSLHHSPGTPSPAKSRPVQVRSASPRCGREDRTFHSTSQTPSLRSNYHYTGRCGSSSSNNGVGGCSLPNYMAATESAKARIRSLSAPRQRPSTSERDRVGSAKKRLSFPAHPGDAYGYGHGGYSSYGSYAQSLRSPSFKSVCGSQYGIDQVSIYSSCCPESLNAAAANMSPSSSGDLRR